MASIKIRVEIQHTDGGVSHGVSFDAASTKCPDERDEIPGYVAQLVERALAPYAKLAAGDAARLNAALAELEHERSAKKAAQEIAKPERPARARRNVDDGGLPL